MSDHLKQLGNKVELPDAPEKAVLERIPWGLDTHPQVVRFTCPEFTSLCPVTGQPDFATFVIDYEPIAWLVESKSLKLLMGSFRNTGEFHEGCTNYIAARLWRELEPNWLRVASFWYPRGGIPIDCLVTLGELSGGTQALQLNPRDYQGR